jgi:hypothetical protein
MHETGRLPMKSARLLAALAPQRKCLLSSSRQSWLLSGASMPQPEAVAVNFECVAVDDAGATGDALGRRSRCCEQKNADEPSHTLTS